MADDNNDSGQQTLPGTTGDDDAAQRAAKAEERARKAEARAKEVERKQKERDDAAAKAKRDADIKSADDARRALAEAEEREKRAMARLEAFEKREAQRIEQLVKQLPEADQARVTKYRERLGDDFGSFVEDEVARLGGGGTDDPGIDGVAAPEANPPPPANPGEIKRRNMGQGRTIEPWAAARLDELGIDTTAARNSLEVERDGRSAKFIFPPQKMKKMLRERAQQPAVLSQEAYEKLHKR